MTSDILLLGVVEARTLPTVSQGGLKQVLMIHLQNADMVYPWNIYLNAILPRGPSLLNEVS
jgi:hypothetical protein